MEQKKYFENFKWAIPLSFKDAIAKCKFEVGDLIYDDKSAYENEWGIAINKIKYSIQIKQTFGVDFLGENLNDEKIFENNWSTQIKFDYTEYPNNFTREIISTQGALYYTIWKADSYYLFNNIERPQKPMMLKDVLKNKSKFRHIVINQSKQKFNHLFYFPFDISNQESQNKITSISTILKNSLGKLQYEDYTINLINHNIEQDRIAPTVYLKVFGINETEERIQELLKRALYKPNPNKQTDRDNFKLTRHGILI